MRRSCFLVAIRRVEFVDRRLFTVLAPPDKSLLSDNSSESSKTPAWALLVIKFPLLDVRPP